MVRVASSRLRYTRGVLRNSILILALGGTAACSANDDIETVYDPCSPLTIAVAPDLGAAETQGIEGAIAAWAQVLPAQIVIGAGPRADDVLPIEFVPGDTFYRGIYWDSLGTISIGRDRLAPEDYALAIAHEMGHAFGLYHVAKSDRASVMNVGNLELAPNDDDAAAVRAHWDTCQPTE
jgi:hypothetical protein